MLPVAVPVDYTEDGIILHMQFSVYAVVMIRCSQYDLLHSQFAAEVAFHVMEEVALYLGVE